MERSYRQSEAGAWLGAGGRRVAIIDGFLARGALSMRRRGGCAAGTHHQVIFVQLGRVAWTVWRRAGVAPPSGVTSGLHPGINLGLGKDGRD